MKTINNWKTNELIFDFTKQKSRTNKCKLCNREGERRYCFSSKGWGQYCLKCCPLPIALKYRSISNFIEEVENVSR